MPKLPTVRPRAVIRFLEQNGFVLDHVSDAISFSTIRSHDAARLYAATTGMCQKEL
jgi:hypothetical protein